MIQLKKLNECYINRPQHGLALRNAHAALLLLIMWPTANDIHQIQS